MSTHTKGLICVKTIYVFQTLGIQASDWVAMVRDSGEMMSRFPPNNASLGQVITDSPDLCSDAAPSGSFLRVAKIVGVERIYYYYKPVWGLADLVKRIARYVVRHCRLLDGRLFSLRMDDQPADCMRSIVASTSYASTVKPLSASPISPTTTPNFCRSRSVRSLYIEL